MCSKCKNQRKTNEANKKYGFLGTIVIPVVEILVKSVVRTVSRKPTVDVAGILFEYCSIVVVVNFAVWKVLDGDVVFSKRLPNKLYEQST